ncbi:MAG: HD domain-containing protein [Nanoarchaeota archaeon]
MKTNDKQRKIETLTYLAKELMPELPYHNFDHAKDVYCTTTLLASLADLDYENQFLLGTAALLHDIVMIPKSKDNEEKSAEFARQYLPRIGYSAEQADQVGNLILATKMPQKPKGFLEKIICDADLDNLGRPDFFELGEKVRLELGLPASESWYQQQLQFLRNHQYHTEVARTLRDSGKAVNLETLEKNLRRTKC